MAQVRTADRAGTDDFKFGLALAASSASECLAYFARRVRTRRSLRAAATALVQRLLSAFFAIGILLQPVHRSLRTGGVFYFNNDAAGLGFAADGQRSVAAQAAAQRHDLLASSERLRPAGPALLKLKI